MISLIEQCNSFITARKRSLRRLCFYRCLSVHRGGVRVTWPTTHAPPQPRTPPGNHARPPATTHAPRQPCTPPHWQPCTPRQPRMPPGNHARPLATMHAPPGNHARPPSNHACPPATTHTPPSQSRYRKSTFFTSFFEYLYRLMSKTCSKNHIKFIYGHIS